jgi:hypothetical protein
VHVHARLATLREGQWHEYAGRFLMGGVATVLTGIVAAVFGPIVGGLFLAFPAIMPATATLVAKHERERKEQAGLSGTRRGQEVAAIEASGAALGSIGLIAFAAVIWLTVPKFSWLSLLFACAAWIVVSLLMWVIRRPLRRLLP